VDQIEDLSLAFSQATRKSLLKTAVVMPVAEGGTFYVDGVMIDGTFHLSGLIGVDTGEPPFRFERGLVAPPGVSDHDRDNMVRIAIQALGALECRDGCVHVEVVLAQHGAVVTGVFGAPAALRFPADVVLLAHGVDTIANALRFALDEPLQMETTRNRGAALLWIPTHSGIVADIRGIEEARRIPGVEEVVMIAGPGDVMGHVVDCDTRDRVGYVIATGDDVEAAAIAAKRARDLCEIVTRPAYSCTDAPNL
jgi:biotin carboxylase